MTKLERDVWVAAFANANGGFIDRAIEARFAVEALRKLKAHFEMPEFYEGGSMLREVLASSAEGEGNG